MGLPTASSIPAIGLAALLTIACGGKAESSYAAASGGTDQGGNTSAGATDNAAGTGPTTTSPLQALEQACPALLQQLSLDPTQICEVESAVATYAPFNFLILLDSSSSMASAPEGFTKPIWEVARDAIGQNLQLPYPELNIGFLLYPFSRQAARGRCDLEPGISIDLARSAQTVPAMVELMSRTTPMGGRPMAAALKAAHDYFAQGAGLAVPGRKYVILITDGGSNCNPYATCGTDPPNSCSDDVAVIDRIKTLRAISVDTFVVGLPGSESFADSLDAFATSGGTARRIEPHDYFAVTSEAGLGEFFQSLFASPSENAPTCTQPLEHAPQDLNRTYVAVDCQPVPRASANAVNWTYNDATRAIEYWGSACEFISTNYIDRMDVIAGCPVIGGL